MAMPMPMPMDEARVFGGAFPVLHTERLVLRELREDDIAAANRMFRDEEVMRYLGKPVHASIEDTRKQVERDRVQFAERTGIRWAITRRGVDEHIGSAGAWRLMKEHHRAEIGYDLQREAWGQGIMDEALRAILRFAFVEMELHSIEAQIDPDNLRSRRVLERLGFRLDGQLRENFFFAGRYTDTAIFTLLRREFAISAQSA